jgi:hypothetical protein
MVEPVDPKHYINCALFADPDEPVEADRALLFYPMPGCVVVQMGTYRTTLAFSMMEGPTPDYGMVLASGPGVPLAYGDRVFVHPAHGKHMAGVSIGGKTIPGEVHYYGRAAGSGGRPVKIAWWKSIPILWAGEMKATGNNVIVDRGPVVRETEGGILLPDDARYRSTKGCVVSVGPEAARRYPDLKPGAVVYYLANCMLPLKGLVENGEVRNWGVIDADGILCEVAP